MSGSTSVQPPKPERERAAPEDVKAALAEGVDLSLELALIGCEKAHKSVTKKRELPPAAWRPTDDERARVSKPIARIIARHTKNADVVDVDAVDIALAGTGLMAIALRSVRERPQTPKENNGSGIDPT